MSTAPTPVSPAARRASRIVSAIPALFLAFDATVKFTTIPEVAAATAQLGWRPETAPALGTLLLGCLALYLWPRTSVLGAVLLTGYLGGAVATHVRVGNPIFTHVLFPTYLGALLWVGLWLRDARVRALVPVPRLTERLRAAV